jgi:hypothetical protein
MSICLLLKVEVEATPLFKPITSFFNILISIPVGVTTKKKTKLIIIGDIIFPSKIPNLIHNLFKDVNKLGLKIVIIKNANDKTTNQTLIDPPNFNG